MALVDVKSYYYKMLAQYLEMKADLADFEQALQDGFITEDQVVEAKEEVNKLEENYHRLTYIMYLLEMPKRPSRRKKFEKSNEKFMKRFKQVGADIDSIVDENTSCLMHFRDELNKLKENKE
jgi:hypothetical protein